MLALRPSVLSDFPLVVRLAEASRFRQNHFFFPGGATPTCHLLVNSRPQPCKSVGTQHLPQMAHRRSHLGPRGGYRTASRRFNIGFPIEV